MTVAQDIVKSREHEMLVYLGSMEAMYDNAFLQNVEIYDLAAGLTDDFRSITADAVLADSRIIRVLRYAIAPSISQMKFGQFFGISSIDRFENQKVANPTAKHRELQAIAPRIATFVTEHLDKSRFLWLEEELEEGLRGLARDYARKWTCSIAADQNAQTRYRNWRKDQQEHAIAGALIDLEYTRSLFRGLLSNSTDIAIGEFAQETRIQGRTRQKADLVVRAKVSKKIVLIEAKAVGVEIDSTKRIKECCDKASDWKSCAALGNPIVVAIIGGFFTEIGIRSLEASGITVIWEHRLSDLERIL